LIADFSGRAVVRLTSGAAGVEGARLQAGAQAETLPLSGTVYERVLRIQEVDVQALDDGARMIAPRHRTGGRHRAAGTGRRRTRPPPWSPMSPPPRTPWPTSSSPPAGTPTGSSGDSAPPFSLAAEIQRRLLPASHTYEAGVFTLAGWLEPAATVGGDTFDYMLNRDALRLSITDAVGHEVESALLATLLVGALRNARRKGSDLAAQAKYANDALAEDARAGQFVTGQLLRVLLSSGAAAIVIAGHPLPLRLRDGGVPPIRLGIEPPFGVVPGRSFQRSVSR
jgi:hypothetical protein